MKAFRWTKLKILSLVLTASFVAIAAGGSIAFFTDSRETTSVFTAGNVYIELSEAAVVRDASGNMVADVTKDRVTGAAIDSATPVTNNYGSVFPGQMITKDPTIKNIGDGSAWVAAKVIINDGAQDVHNLFGYDGYDELDIERLLAGGLLDEIVNVGVWNGIEDVCYNDNYAMVQVADRANDTYEFYFIMLNPIEKDESVLLFDTMTIHPLFGNEQMVEFKELSITVQAFAVQTFGFSDCYSAMSTAFGEYFVKCAANP